MQCNAACTYCAARRAGATSARMSVSILERLFAFVAHLARAQSVTDAHPGGVTILWHGGEPLLMGREFYERVLVLTSDLSRQGLKIRHRMQTNLLDWNDDLAEVLSRLLHERRLSSSAEPLGLGDRRLAGGGSYMGRWLEQVRDVLGREFRLGLVCVVDGRIAARPQETYHYFKNLLPAPQVRFNPLYPQSRELPMTGERLLTPVAWGRFLRQMWQMWEADERSFCIEPLQTFAGLVGGRRRHGTCDMSGRCGTGFLAVGPEGDVHQCGRALDAGILRYGNIATGSFDEILAAPNRVRICSRPVELSAGTCAQCRWWELCHGGCPVQAWMHGRGWHEPTHWCEGRRFFFELAFEHEELGGINVG